MPVVKPMTNSRPFIQHVSWGI